MVGGKKMKYFNDTLEYDVWPSTKDFCGLTYDEFRVLLNGFIILAYDAAKKKNLTDKQMKIRSPFHCIIGQNSSSVVVGISTDNAIRKRSICTSLNKEQSNMTIEQLEDFMEKVCEEELGYAENTFIELDKTILKNKLIKESLQGKEKFIMCFTNELAKLENIFKENHLNQEIKNEYKTAMKCWNLLIMSVSRFIDNLDRGIHKVEFNPKFKARDMVIKEKQAFYILPFTEAPLDAMLAIKEAITTNEIDCEIIKSEDRFDPKRGNDIVENIWQDICTSKFIIADLSEKNPNVFYELGICDAIGKTIIPICSNKSREKDYNGSLPFDISSQYTIFYEEGFKGYKELQEKVIARIKVILDMENSLRKENISSYQK